MHISETLQTEGVTQARRGEHAAALETLKHAANAAEEAGEREYSGQVFLTIIEELKRFLPPDQINEFYAVADQRLGESVSRETLERLRACARSLIGVSAPGTTNAGGTARIPFTEEVRKCESALIKRALE